jgi:hypothetical protein
MMALTLPSINSSESGTGPLKSLSPTGKNIIKLCVVWCFRSRQLKGYRTQESSMISKINVFS